MVWGFMWLAVVAASCSVSVIAGRVMEAVLGGALACESACEADCESDRELGCEVEWAKADTIGKYKALV